MTIVIFSTPQRNDNIWIELLKSLEKLEEDCILITKDFKQIEKWSEMKAPEMFICPTDLFINAHDYNFDEDLLKFKIEDEKKRQRQKAGLKIHKSKKYKVYF